MVLIRPKKILKLDYYVPCLYFVARKIPYSSEFQVIHCFVCFVLHLFLEICIVLQLSAL